MQSVLNNQFSKELNILDSLFGRLLDTAFKLESPYFYAPNEKNTQLIANTFDIDISNESVNIAKKLIEKPILKKTKLGTYNGIREVVEPIFGHIDIQTHATNAQIEPFTFEIQIEPSNTNIINLKKAQHLINQYKPLRDSYNGIQINFPQAQIPLEIASLGVIRMRIYVNMQLNRTLQAKTYCSAVAKWDLSL